MILYQRYNIEKPKSSIPGFISWKTYQRTESDNQWSDCATLKENAMFGMKDYSKETEMLRVYG